MSGGEDLATLRAGRLARLRGAAPAEPAAAVLRFRRPGAPAQAPAAILADAPAGIRTDGPAGEMAEEMTEMEPAGPAVAGTEAPAAPPAPACDLDRLPGAGPGLVRALRRAGIGCVADLATLAPEDLAGRLGPLGGLVPAAAWIAAAQEAAAQQSGTEQVMAEASAG